MCCQEPSTKGIYSLSPGLLSAIKFRVQCTSLGVLVAGLPFLSSTNPSSHQHRGSGREIKRKEENSMNNDSGKDTVAIDLKLSDIEITELQFEDALGIPELGASICGSSCSFCCTCCCP